jgi:hypothetical protein
MLQIISGKFFESAERHTRNAKGITYSNYSWVGLRYFLYEYELYLHDLANGNQKLSWIDFNKRKKEETIEHIYPQTPKDDCWNFGFSDYSDEDKKKICHSLGNLVLLAGSKNSELLNKCFGFKKKHTNVSGNEVGFFNGSFSEIQVSSYDKWTPEEIANRGIDLLNFLEYRWGINFGDWENVTKEDLLHIELKNKV